MFLLINITETHKCTFDMKTIFLNLQTLATQSNWCTFISGHVDECSYGIQWNLYICIVSEKYLKRLSSDTKFSASKAKPNVSAWVFS